MGGRWTERKMSESQRFFQFVVFVTIGAILFSICLMQFLFVWASLLILQWLGAI